MNILDGFILKEIKFIFIQFQSSYDRDLYFTNSSWKVRWFWSGFDNGPEQFLSRILGTLGWIRLPVLGEEKFTLHYSNPDDFQQSRSAGDLRPIEINSNQSPAEFCVYGFEAGSFRRHIRLCDIHGDVIEDILLLLDIDPVRISRSFDITLGGIPSTRKIEVANPYSEERTFYLHTRKSF